MTRYVAFLRAINVGGRTVKMDRLKQLFEGAGFKDVRTFIASGNVIFHSPSKSIGAVERKIENHLQKALGYGVTTFVRTDADLKRIAEYDAFGATDGSPTIYVAFLHSEPGKEPGKKLMTFRSRIDDFHIHKSEIYWLCRKTISVSEFSPALLEKTLGMPATLRNSTTVRKLAALLTDNK
jgi:uncharacterized protein (DUF1697 family)